MLSLVLAMLALPAGSQQLLDQAKAATPARYQFAIDNGVKIEAAADGKSFCVSWIPAGATAVVATLHGSESWALDEFYLWHDSLSKAGYGIVALQWWLGSGDNYLTPETMTAEFQRALPNLPVLLHGFSRGSANIYAMAALGERRYDMVIANSGGMTAGFPPNTLIEAGTYGYNVYSGTYWITSCGGTDPNPDRDGCPAMRRTAEWIRRWGGVVELAIEDATLGHGAFHLSAAHVGAALDAFRKNQEMRKAALPAATQWAVKPDAAFSIAGASIPNVGLVGGQVSLMVGTQGGARLYRNGAMETVPGLAESLNGTGYNVGEVVPRELSNGTRALYVLGLAGPGVNRAVVYRLVEGADGKFARDPAAPVFSEEPYVGVPDVTPTVDGRLRLTYVALTQTPNNSRTALSSDGGISFTREFENPFGDLAVPNASAATTNVDPAVLKLSKGGYIALTMRDRKLYLFTSLDGKTFLPAALGAMDGAALWPGTVGLYDPTLVETAGGRVWFYCTADTRVVRAELLRPSIAGVLNAASGGASAAPGSIVSIYGTDMTGAVTIGGKTAPLFYSSTTQINAQVPVETPLGTAEVAVGSTKGSVTVAATAPGIFRLAGEYATLDAALAGGYATIYLTGQGAVSPAVATGAIAAVNPLSWTVAETQVTVGTANAPVLYSGLCPGFIGLTQVNFGVPALTAGSYTLTVRMGAASDAAKVQVR